jgi:hypothetical protein
MRSVIPCQSPVCPDQSRAPLGCRTQYLQLGSSRRRARRHTPDRTSPDKHRLLPRKKLYPWLSSSNTPPEVKGRAVVPSPEYPPWSCNRSQLDSSDDLSQAHHSATGLDLDEVRSWLQLLPGRFAYLSRTICLDAILIAVPTGHGYAHTTRENARTDDHSLLNRFFRGKIHLADGPMSRIVVSPSLKQRRALRTHRLRSI